MTATGYSTIERRMLIGRAREVTQRTSRGPVLWTTLLAGAEWAAQKGGQFRRGRSRASGAVWTRHGLRPSRSPGLDHEFGPVSPDFVRPQATKTKRTLSFTSLRFEPATEGKLAVRKIGCQENCCRENVGEGSLLDALRDARLAWRASELIVPLTRLVHGRDSAAAKKCLEKLTSQQRGAVETHRVDMGKVYGPVCNGLLPNSRMVVDRFHVAKQFNDVVRALRKDNYTEIQGEVIDVRFSLDVNTGEESRKLGESRSVTKRPQPASLMMACFMCRSLKRSGRNG